MKSFSLIIACLLLFVSCKNQEKRIIHSNVIDIEHGLQNLTRLKTSDFGKTIRYIPLETTDDGLVGRNPVFKEEFVDTLYTVTDRKLVPSIVFNTGKYHWQIEDRWSTKNASERIFIADVSENDNFVFFQCFKGMNSNITFVFYNGLYHKNTGKTMLGNNSDAIEDDLTHFMPFIPYGMSTAGEFVSFAEAYKIMEWLEKHPAAKNNEKLPFLKELDAEMNPIVILIE